MRSVQYHREGQGFLHLHFDVSENGLQRTPDTLRISLFSDVQQPNLSLIIKISFLFFLALAFLKNHFIFHSSKLIHFPFPSLLPEIKLNLDFIHAFSLNMGFKVSLVTLVILLKGHLSLFIVFNHSFPINVPLIFKIPAPFESLKPNICNSSRDLKHRGSLPKTFSSFPRLGDESLQIAGTENQA